MPNDYNTGPGEIPWVSIKDMCRNVSHNLRGSLREIGDTFTIMVLNTRRDSFVSINASGSSNEPDRCNLNFKTGAISYKIVRTDLNLLRLENLFVTWEQPKRVTFLYFQADRFNIITVSGEATVVELVSQDRRIDEPANMAAEMRDKGRTFYHVGEPRKPKPEEVTDTSAKPANDGGEIKSTEMTF